MENLIMRKDVIYNVDVQVKAGLRFTEHNYKTGMMYTWEVKEVIAKEFIKGATPALDRYQWFVRAELVREEWYDQYISRTTNWGKKKYVYEAMTQKDLENEWHLAKHEGDTDKMKQLEKHMFPHIVMKLNGQELPKFNLFKFVKSLITGKSY